MKYKHLTKQELNTSTALQTDQLENDSKAFLDLKVCDVRQRSSDMEKIINEMTIGGNASRFNDANHKNDGQTDNTEDDLIALIDNEL